MKMTKQGVRDLSKQEVVLIEPATNIAHMPHFYFLGNTRCGLNTNQQKMYRPLEPQAVTCIACLGWTKDENW
jgi:hypothetical protein